MKKAIIIILVLLTSTLVYKEIKNNTAIIPNTAIRLRVIPNSNSIEDQKMKDKVKKYLENNTYNLLKGEKNIEEARQIIKQDIPNIQKNIEKIFKENEYDIDYNINYGYNYFPTKNYDGITYDEGYYESLVISIGKAEGDNWWCVLFPNLCLVDLQKNNSNKYKSWILEKINKLF